MVDWTGVFSRLSDYAKSKFSQMQALFSKGLAPQAANHIIKETSALNPDEKKGVQPWEALAVWREFRSAAQQTLSNLPSMRSQWLRASLATPTTFSSPLDYRYLIDYEFQYINPRTGGIETVSNTIGFRRLQRWGGVLDMIENRIRSLADHPEGEEGSGGVPAGITIVDDSIVIKGFFRTQNS